MAEHSEAPQRPASCVVCQESRPGLAWLRGWVRCRHCEVALCRDCSARVTGRLGAISWACPACGELNEAVLGDGG